MSQSTSKMSLLPDITKQNTDIQQDNTEGQQPPSVDDIINWHIEQSINLGTIGWTMNFPTADFFKDFDPAPFAEAATFDGDIDTDILDAALHEFAAEQERLIDRMNVMEANRPLLEATELEVHRRLLQAGKTQQDIDHYIREKTRLGRKIEDLYRLQYPDPPKNYVEAFINYGPAHNRRSAEINLDINGSLANFESSIKITLECFRDMWEPLASVHHEGSSWKFQWKPKDKSGKTEEKWFPLETERDYKDLIRQATSPSKEQYTPVLTQVSLLVSSSKVSHTNSVSRKSEQNPRKCGKASRRLL